MIITMKQNEVTTNLDISNTKAYTKKEIYDFFINLDTKEVINIKKDDYIHFKNNILSSATNLQKFTEIINRILKSVPTFNLKTFLENEILFLAKKYVDKNNYENSFFQKIESRIKNAEKAFKTRITNIFKQKAINIAQKFNINDPEQQLPKLFYNLKNLNDPKFNKTDMNSIFKKIGEEMDKNSLQIPGLSGIYDQLIFNRKMDTNLKKLGVCLPNESQDNQQRKKQADSLGKYIITYIANYYKNLTKNAFTPSIIDLNFIEMTKLNKAKNSLDLLEKIIPGIKSLLTPLLNHDNKKYGFLKININETNYGGLADIDVVWNYNDIKVVVYNRTNVQIINKKTSVETAYDLLNKYYMGDNLLPTTDFEIPAMIDAFGTNFNALINSLLGKKWNEITENQLKKLAENAMMADQKSKIAEKVNNLLLEIAKIKEHLKVDIMIEYFVPISTQKIKFKLNIVERESKTTLPEEKSFDLLPSKATNTRFTNTMGFLYPSQIIQKLIANSKKMVLLEQDFDNYQNGASFNNEYFFKELELGKKIRASLERWKNFKYNNVNIINSVNKLGNTEELKNTYLLYVTIQDKNLSANSKTNAYVKKSYWSTFKIKPIEAQLKPIWDALLKFGGKKDSIFDPTITHYSEDQKKSLGSNEDLNKMLVYFDGITTLSQILKNELPDGAEIKHNFVKLAKATYPTNENERGLGITWMINLKRQDIFGKNDISMQPGIKNSYIYEYNKTKEGDVKDAKNDVKNVFDSSIQIAKAKLKSNQKNANEINAKNMKIKSIYNEFVNNVNKLEQKSELSRILLHNMKQEEIKKITQELENITHFGINTLKIIQKVEDIGANKWTPKQIMAINNYPELFKKILEITKKKDVFETLLNDIPMLESMNKYIGSDVFQKTLDATIKTKNYYKYSYFGVGVASAIVGLSVGAASLSSINAKRKLAKISTKKAKIRGGKLVAWITTLIALSAIGISVGTELWFFIAEGGF